MREDFAEEVISERHLNSAQSAPSKHGGLHSLLWLETAQYLIDAARPELLAEALMDLSDLTAHADLAGKSLLVVASKWCVVAGGESGGGILEVVSRA